MSVFDNIKFPFLTHQQLNLDWILTEIKRIMGYFPESGESGNVLMKTDDGAAWEPLEAVDININSLPEDTELTDTDKLVFYDLSASANRKITAPNLLNSMMSNGMPLMDGTASPGTSKKPARYDHRHPTDTSRAPAAYFQNGSLKIGNGGTGADNAPDARANLGLGDAAVEDVIPVTKGGTGATEIYSALAHLGINLTSGFTIDLAFSGGECYLDLVSGSDIYRLAWNDTIIAYEKYTGGAWTTVWVK